MLGLVDLILIYSRSCGIEWAHKYKCSDSRCVHSPLSSRPNYQINIYLLKSKKMSQTQHQLKNPVYW